MTTTTLESARQDWRRLGWFCGLLLLTAALPIASFIIQNNMGWFIGQRNVAPLEIMSLVTGAVEGFRLAVPFTVFAWLAIDASSAGRRLALLAPFVIIHVLVIITSIGHYQYHADLRTILPIAIHGPALAISAYCVIFALMYFKGWTIRRTSEPTKPLASRTTKRANLSSLMELTVLIALGCAFFLRWQQTLHFNGWAIFYEFAIYAPVVVSLAAAICCLFQMILGEGNPVGRLRAWGLLMMLHCLVWVFPISIVIYAERSTFRQQDTAIGWLTLALTAVGTIFAAVFILILRRMGYRLSTNSKRDF